MNHSTLNKGATAIRERSWAVVAKHGLNRNDQLPLLDGLTIQVTERAAAMRLLCMYAVGVCAFGYPVAEARRWLESEGILGNLSNREIQYLDGDRSLVFMAQTAVSSAYSLAWASSLVPDQALMTNLPDNFVGIVPDIRKHESSADLTRRLRFRNIDEIVPYLDLAYCLHWALRDAQMHLKKTPKLSQLPLVAAQRKSLEWLLTGDDWDEISLDT